MRLHPVAWVGWALAVTAFALAVTNPLYLVLALGAVLVVHVSRPRDASPAGRAVRTFLVLGFGLLAMRLLFVALLVNPGRTTLLVLPRVALPHWLGGFGLGGRVTAEVLVQACVEGLQLVVVLAAFGVLNASVDTSTLVRAVPAAFRDAGLVVSIALAFVPGLLTTVRDVRDAQRLRAEHGVRTLAPSLVIPVLGMTLERALLLAESMDARGYGRGDARPSKLALPSLAGLVAGIAVWVSGRGGLALLLVCVGGAGLATSLRGRSATTRLKRERPRLRDLAVIAFSVAGALAAVLVARDATFNAYPSVHLPGFTPLAGAAALLLAAPAVGGAA